MMVKQHDESFVEKWHFSQELDLGKEGTEDLDKALKEGILLGRQKAICRILEKKFGKISRLLQLNVEAIFEEEELERILDGIIEVRTFQDAVNLVGRFNVR